jgi:hypothetical protein
MNAVAQSEIARYVDGVRAALSDLPAKKRDELLEDLPEHLAEVAAEVAAEGAGTLEERLGPPAQYAAELRASAGVPAPGERRRPFGDALADAGVETRRRLRQADRKIGPLIGYGTVSEFLSLLRPAWWVLRGYLAAVVVTYLFDASGGDGLVPRIGGNELAGLVMLVLFVFGSIWLGRRTAGLSIWPRRLVLLGGALIVVFALLWFSDVDRAARNTFDGNYTTVYSTPYDHVSDVFVYDAEGRLLTDVYLYDQFGQPIVLGGDVCARTDGPPLGPVDGNYPRCPENAPWPGRPPAAEPSPPAPSTPSAVTPTPVPSPTG